MIRSLQYNLNFQYDRFTHASCGSRHISANNASFTIPATVTITATAADSDGTVTKVDIYNGATLVTSAPYSVTMAGFGAGTYSYTAVATDNSGASTTSSTISFTVSAANVPPTVSIISPSNNASYTAPANISIAANAASNNGTIAKVDFYANGNLIGTSTSVLTVCSTTQRIRLISASPQSLPITAVPAPPQHQSTSVLTVA